MKRGDSMLFGKKLALRKEIFEKAEALREVKGYSSLEELVEHLIDKEFELIREGGDEKTIEKLKGLGYIS